MYYVDVTADDLKNLRQALVLLERLRSGGEPLNLYLYGITTDPGVLDAAKEAIAAYGDDETVTESDVQLAEIAVEMRLNSDTLYYLNGSGARLQKGDEFTYLGGPGEGAREIGWNWTRRGPTVTLASFTHMAVAEDSGWGDKFLMQYGQKIPLKIDVKRNQPSTGVAPQAQPAPTQVPKQTSVPGGKQLEDLMEKFLGD